MTEQEPTQTNSTQQPNNIQLLSPMASTETGNPGRVGE